MSNLPNEPHLTLSFLREVAGRTWLGCTHDAVFAGGVDYMFSTITPNSLLVVVDSPTWDKTRIERSGQYGKSDLDIYHLAKDKGVAGFVSSREFVGHDLPVIRVDNTKKFLLKVAYASRARYTGKLVAVTGTAGKSSTVAIVLHLLRSLGISVLGPIGNQNTFYSVAAELTRLSKSVDVAVFETAVSGFARFKQHVGKLVRPHVAVVTQISKGQMDLVDTEEDTARFKGMLIESLEPDGAAIYNADTKQADYLESISKRFATDIVQYGRDAERFRLIDFSVAGSYEGEVLARVNGRQVHYSIPYPSKAMAYNTIAALAVIDRLGLLSDDVYQHLSSIPKGKRILEVSDVIIESSRVRVIDDTKNATIPSAIEALDVLCSIGQVNGRRILVIGYIVNLGVHSDSVHRELAVHVLASKPDLVFGYGDAIEALMEGIPEELRGGISSDPREIAEMVRATLRDGDTVLIKGSHRGTRFREVPDLIKQGAQRTGPHSEKTTQRHSSRAGGERASLAEASSSTPATIRLLIHGKVQKVGFRKWLIERAANDIDGWVRNRSDGTLEAVLRGHVDHVAKLTQQCHAGPSRAEVSEVISEKYSGKLRPGFRSRRTIETDPDVARTSLWTPLSYWRKLVSLRANGVFARSRRKFTHTHALTFCGDTSLGDSYLRGKTNSALLRLCNNPLSFFEQVRPIISGSNRIVANLETTLVDSMQSPFEGRKQYLTRDDPERTLKVLKEIGITAVNLGNNHTKDFGNDGLRETISNLRAAGIQVFGAGENLQAASKPFARRIRVRGREKALFILSAYEIERRYKEQYNFYATSDSPGVNPLSRRRMTARIERLRTNNPDALIIVCPHWYRNYKWAGKKERTLCSASIAAGADLIIGSGSHMLGSCHWSDEGTQVLSLGNFIYNSPGRYEKLSAPPFSLIARLELGLRDEGWSSALKLYPIVTDNRLTNFQVQPVDRNMLARVYSLLAEHAVDASAFVHQFEEAEDERGLHIKLTRPISPRFVCTASSKERSLHS